MVHSERGWMVLASVDSYIILTLTNDGPNVVHRKVKIRDPGQCVSALRSAKLANVRCMVYAVGEAYGEECQELVDEDFLLGKMR